MTKDIVFNIKDKDGKFKEETMNISDEAYAIVQAIRQLKEEIRQNG